MGWNAAEIPDQHGRTAVVTGANGGLGLETARQLAALAKSGLMVLAIGALPEQSEGFDPSGKADRQVREAMAALGIEEKGAVVVTAAEGWHPGVVGIVAARLKEKFGRPAFAIALEPGGTGTGSGR